MGEVAEVFKAFVSPVEKLIDNISKGIGVAYEPRHVRKMADAKAYEIQKIGAAIQEATDLPVNYDKGSIAIDSNDVAGLIQRANHRQAMQAVRKQHNTDKIVGKACELLESAQPVENIPIDEDWLNRFFDAAENVSSEDMQLIWAKILAGEAEIPGRFSLRTLEIVKNLSREEASLFQKISPLTLLANDNRVIVAEEDILKKYGVFYSDILKLDECGLINSSPAIMPRHVQKGGIVVYLTPARVMHITSSENATVDVSLSIYKLTKPAQELLSILEYDYNEDYFFDIAENIYDRHCQRGISISVHIVEELIGDTYKYLLDPIRKFEK